ncbi:hypothetical protein DAMA08_046430 [Martiniozyma asiatica (nom. inval.)]|nr:hypothetical protein DAMA08_046430 [Martiniozyma asiatica]
MSLSHSILFIVFLCLVNLSRQSVLGATGSHQFVQFDLTKKYTRGPFATVDLGRGNLHKREVELAIQNSEVSYYVQVQLGSNGQNVTLLLDTGSSDTWVNMYCPGDDESDSSDDESDSSDEGSADESDAIASVDGQCYTLPNTGNLNIAYNQPYMEAFANELEKSYSCSEFGIFTPQNSKTCQNTSTPFYLEYADGSSVSGFLVDDHFKIGQVVLDNATFGVSDSIGNTNGFFGIGFQLNQATYQNGQGPLYDSILMKLKNNGYINKVVYSIKAALGTGGSFLIGAYDRAAYTGQLTLLPLVSFDIKNDKVGTGPWFLSVTLSSFSLKNLTDSSPELVAKGAIPAIFDSGSPRSTLPSYLIDFLIVKFKFQWSDQVQAYVTSQSNLQGSDSNSILTFNFQGFDINIPTIKFTYPVLDVNTLQDSGLRMLAIDASDGDYLLLGDDFLSDVYLVTDLDAKQVAIAKVNSGSTQEEIVVVQNKIADAVKAPHWDAIFSSSNSEFSIVSKIPDPSTFDNNYNSSLVAYYPGMDLGYDR